MNRMVGNSNHPERGTGSTELFGGIDYDFNKLRLQSLQSSRNMISSLSLIFGQQLARYKKLRHCCHFNQYPNSQYQPKLFISSSPLLNHSSIGTGLMEHKTVSKRFETSSLCLPRPFYGGTFPSFHSYDEIRSNVDNHFHPATDYRRG